jgi:hypothetical protein
MGNPALEVTPVLAGKIYLAIQKRVYYVSMGGVRARVPNTISMLFSTV